MAREFWNSQCGDYKDCSFIHLYWLMQVFFSETSVNLCQAAGGHILCKTKILKA